MHHGLLHLSKLALLNSESTTHFVTYKKSEQEEDLGSSVFEGVKNPLGTKKVIRSYQNM